MGKLIELIICSLPYPDQMRDIEIALDYVAFTWRGVRYRITETFGVDEVRNGLLIGSDTAILMRACIDWARAADVSAISREAS